MNNDKKKTHVNDDRDSLSPEELLAKHNLVRKDGMYIVQKPPVEKRQVKTPEQVAEFRKQAHDADVRQAKIACILDAKSRWEQMAPIFQRIKNICFDLDGFFESLEHTGLHSDPDDVIKMLEQSFAGLNAQYTLWHHACTDPGLNHSFSNDLYATHLHEAQEQIFLSKDVNVVPYEIDGEPVILVQMPQLFSVYFNYQKARGGFPYPTSWLPQFRRELRMKLNEIYPTIVHSKAYHLAFVHVYEHEVANMIDNDNRDVKGVIDEISQILTMSDRATYISFSACTIIDKKIKEGSYICISSDYGNPVRLEKIQATLQQLFCSLLQENLSLAKTNKTQE